MKIEKLFYSLSKVPIDDENFNLEQWKRDNPVDYFKFIYVLFNSTKINNSIPSDSAMDTAFDAIYRISRLYIPNVLYKYFSLTDNDELNEKKIFSLQNQKLYLSNIKDFNDPFDSKAFYYDSTKLSKIKRFAHCGGRLIDDFTVFHKTASLTAVGTNSMPMWAHYSNNHHGFCVSYDMKDLKNLALSSCTFPVQYTDQRLDITSYMEKYAYMLSSQADLQQSQGKKEIKINDLSIIYLALLLQNIKHSSWQYEKEFRCSMGANAKGMPFVDAVPQSIFIGMNCDDIYAKKLKGIADSLQVPIYQMQFDDNNEQFQLKASDYK